MHTLLDLPSNKQDPELSAVSVATIQIRKIRMVTF